MVAAKPERFAPDRTRLIRQGVPSRARVALGRVGEEELLVVAAVAFGEDIVTALVGDGEPNDAASQRVGAEAARGVEGRAR